LLTFTEPYLGFSLASRDESSARVRLHLSLEARPAWVDETVDLFDYFELINVSLDELGTAITAWREDRLRFPER